MWIASLLEQITTFLLWLFGWDRLSSLQQRLDKIRDLNNAEQDETGNSSSRTKWLNCGCLMKFIACNNLKVSFTRPVLHTSHWT